jgi:hypothetical protein
VSHKTTNKPDKEKQQMKRMSTFAVALGTVLIATTANAQRPQDEVQAPRGQEIQAPRSDEVEAPRGEEIQAPRV